MQFLGDAGLRLTATNPPQFLLALYWPAISSYVPGKWSSLGSKQAKLSPDMKERYTAIFVDDDDGDYGTKCTQKKHRTRIRRRNARKKIELLVPP